MHPQALAGRPMNAPRLLLTTLAAAFVLGCANPSRVDIAPERWTALPYRHGTPAPHAAPDAWWSSFDDPVLDALVARATVENLDVRRAVERASAARAGASVEASRLWPTINLQGSASDERTGLAGAAKQGSPDVRTRRLGLDLAWEIDLAGGLRAAKDASQSDAIAAQAGAAGARLVAVGEVVTQYFLLRGVQERLRTLDTLIRAQRDTARLVSSREAQGLASRFDLTRAQGEADSLDAQMPPLRSLAASTQARIAVLLGESPSGFVLEEGSFKWPAASEIGTGQPSDLLRRRPDLLAAEARYAAETHRVQEARAQWWPRLFVSALSGRQDLRLNALDLPASRFSSVALAFGVPLFNAGRIQADIDLQSSRAREALAAWHQAVLVAVEEVEVALATRSQEVQRARSLTAAADARRQALQHAHSLRREGQIDLLTLLDVQRSLLAAELAATESRTQQALNDVRLYKTLGGGWATPSNPSPLKSAGAS